MDVGFVALDWDGLGEAEAAARVTKDVAEDAVKATAENAAKMEIHHLLPQSQNLKPFFERAGLNIEDWTTPLRKDLHTLKPLGIHAGKFEESWNGQWQQFFTKFPNANKQQILDQLAKMRKEFGI